MWAVAFFSFFSAFCLARQYSAWSAAFLSLVMQSGFSLFSVKIKNSSIFCALF